MIRTLNPRLLALGRVHSQHPTRVIPLLGTRSLFNLFKKAPSKPESRPTLSQDNLFHPFSESPFPALVARGEAIKSLAPCPVCATQHEHIPTLAKAQPRAVAFECPDCGWPTHCTEGHWHTDKAHAKYCSRLREANEDEHDLRSGRRLREFELPGTSLLNTRILHLPSFASVGQQDTEAAISFSNWDVFWYTRNFPSMDTERSRRHASKLLTYPITIGSAIHQYSPLTLANQRLTPEGSRSLAGAYDTYHNILSVIHTCGTSFATDATWRHGDARDRRGLDRQTSNTNIRPWSAGRIFPTTPRLGTACVVVPSSIISHLLYRATSFPTKTSCCRHH
jgi:splicing suppressor protein 51